MNTSETYLNYSPSKASSYGHTVRGSSHESTYRKLEDLLSKVAVIDLPERGSLSFYNISGSTDVETRREAIAELQEEFGPPTTIHRTEQEDSLNSFSWDLDASGIPSARSFVLRICKSWSQAKLKDLFFVETLMYYWKDKDTEQILMLCHIRQNRFFVQPSFTLPIPIGDPGLKEMIAELNESLPFKLALRHFRLCVPKKSGEGFNIRKLSPEITALVKSALE